MSPFHSVNHMYIHKYGVPPEPGESSIDYLDRVERKKRAEDPEYDAERRAYQEQFRGGVPGKIYPYPLEDEDHETNDFEAFKKVRDILMRHAHTLAASLQPDDPDINRRSLALARILEQVHQLDKMLPDLNPEMVIRHEYVIDDEVFDLPPWADAELRFIGRIKYLEGQLEQALNAQKADSPPPSRPQTCRLPRHQTRLPQSRRRPPASIARTRRKPRSSASCSAAAGS